jgi:hypothetical protein
MAGGPLPAARRSPTTTSAVLFGCWWFLVKIGAAVGLALAVGGFGTAIATGQGTASGGTGIGLLTLCGGLLVARAAYWRGHRRRTSRLFESGVPLARLHRPVLTAGLVFFVLLVVSALFPAPPGSPAAGYSALTDAIMTILVVEAAVGCAYLLYRCHRRDRSRGRG